MGDENIKYLSAMFNESCLPGRPLKALQFSLFFASDPTPGMGIQLETCWLAPEFHGMLPLEFGILGSPLLGLLALLGPSVV